MAERVLVPSIEKRLGALIEVTRRGVSGVAPERRRTITISREFGCEGFPLAEQLKTLLEERTGEVWALADKTLLDEVAKNHHVSREVLSSLGQRGRFIDDLLSTLSPSWKTEKDYYRLLCEHIVSVATAGNTIVVGMGGAVLTQSLDNCVHFRVVASREFKVRSIARRAGVARQEAEEIVDRKQRERDRFLRDFLNSDPGDLKLYDLVFNNDRATVEKMAHTIVSYMFDA